MANIMDIANLVYKLAEQPAEVADAVIAEFEATKGERSDAIRAIAEMAAIIRAEKKEAVSA